MMLSIHGKFLFFCCGKCTSTPFDSVEQGPKKQKIFTGLLQKLARFFQH